MRASERLRLVVAMGVVAVVAAGAAALGIPGPATRSNQVTGDEPHYLLTAISLVEDGDLDVADELDGRRERPFHRDRLLAQAAPRPDGSAVVPHDPLLPALLALPVAIGGWVGAKLALAALAGVCGALLVWVQVRRFAVPVVTAGVVGIVTTASAPLAVYGHQLYPELPAALATLAAVAALTGRLRRGGLVTLALAVVALPWLSVKYVPVAAVLAALGLVVLVRRGDHRQALLTAAAFVVAGLLYGVAHLAWYGGVTVYAAGSFFQEHGGELSVVGVRPDVVGRSIRLAGLVTDRRFGIAAWQPAWLLVLPALGALVRRRPAGWVALVTPTAAAWIVATFVAATMHGWWFPGRQVVVVLPLLAIALGTWAGRRTWRVAVVGGVGALGVATYLWLAWETAASHANWVVDFATTSNPWYRRWRQLLPDLTDWDAATLALHAAWVAILLAGAVLGWRAAGHRPPGDTPGRSPADGASRRPAEQTAGSGVRPSG